MAHAPVRYSGSVLVLIGGPVLLLSYPAVATQRVTTIIGDGVINFKSLRPLILLIDTGPFDFMLK